jgi:phospholipid/cholesterol/gamma-HCH transport system substrate-binding protein
MATRPPTFTRILIAVGFALSCFGLALFLWIAFGGAVPLKPEGYRFTVPFQEATQLAVESDVRISGVSVGKVKRVDLNDEGYAEATIEIEPRYGPVSTETRATLRQKTLLGETYVELAPGSEESEMLPEDGTLAVGQVSETVQLDEVFRAFDERTRNAFRAWMVGQASSLRGRGDDLSLAIASLSPFAEEAERALRVLDSQELAVREFVRNGGEVFQALSERQGQLRGLIENAATVFETTARRNESLADAFTIFPTFLRESRTTLDRLEQFAIDTDPVVTALKPTARELTPTLRDLGTLSPELEGFFAALQRTISAAPAGFEATRTLLDDQLPPLLDRLDPWLAQVNPILEVIGLYRREVTALLGNAANASNGLLGLDPESAEPLHYVRTLSPLSPEAVAVYPRRLEFTRTNPYLKPGAYLDVGEGGIDVFDDRNCANGVSALLNPATPADPDFNERTGGDLMLAQEFFDRLRKYAFVGQFDTDAIAAPPCDLQAPFESIGTPSEQSRYLHVREYP